MSLKQKLENLTPQNPSESERLRKIIASVDALEIPPEIMRELRMVGSAALTAYGVELGRAPSDVDFAATADAMQALYDLGIAALDTDYAGRQFTILKAEPQNSDNLSVQFILPRPDKVDDKHDARFLKYHAGSPLIPSTNIAVATPRSLHKHLKAEALLDPKYKLDLAALEHHAEITDLRRRFPVKEPIRNEVRRLDSDELRDEPVTSQQDKQSA